jgi:hypothetical protein
MPPRLTPGERWRFRRDLAIYTAWQAGLSQAVLADVHSLTRKGVAAIVGRVWRGLGYRGKPLRLKSEKQQAASARDTDGLREEQHRRPSTDATRTLD